MDEIDRSHLEELLYQAIETELGGARLHETAIECAVNPDLREEWEKYLAETRTHQDILDRIFASAGLDVEVETPGRRVVRQKGEGQMSAVMAAREAGDAALTQLVAAESVVQAETKDHQNWELLGSDGRPPGW